MSLQQRTQRALLVKDVGKPVVHVNDWPIPQPGKDQVQIRVSIAGVNPHVQKARDWGLFIKENLPAVVTNDVVGKVTALGEGVTKYSIGDRVVTHASFRPPWVQGGLQQYAIVDVEHSAKVPDSITDDEAATLPTNVMAPLISIFDPSYLGIPAPWTSQASSFDYKGTTLLVLGGGGNCGKFGVQLAALAGIGRIVVVGGDDHELKSLGATHVIDRHRSPDHVTSEIRDIVGDGLLYAYDAANMPATQHIGVNALSNTQRGKFARLMPIGPIDEAKISPKQNGFQLFDVHGVSHNKPETAVPFWTRLPDFLEEKKIRPTEYTVLSGLTAENINQVLDAYRSNQKVVKTNVHVEE
ncbi:Enoyl LovC [Cyphellophora attinorum]|uniref:Enoyl LovC n=1 Tax=Cyphellophora attinorum TaxID=1664694 RepID=A0A0N0NMD2_9EURO|nr:Enoyl LovC [Phialophora attinorum]KPI40321.1 Enoyl LovC [Phialophora attinorum]